MARSKSSKRKHASFETEGRLLQELGERLVARADVALMELIKNSYDADATECLVSTSKDEIQIRDDGHGMTESEFLARWMRIATPDKQKRRRSRRFERAVTGSKGIGRFAVRFLGQHLRLETTALEPEAQELCTLSADFDWPAIDSHATLHRVEIPYRVSVAAAGAEAGTRLIVTKLRSSAPVDLKKDTRTDLLALLDPYAALTGSKARRAKARGPDPGFNLRLPDSEGQADSDLVESILDHAYARLTIEHTSRHLSPHIKKGCPPVL